MRNKIYIFIIILSILHIFNSNLYSQVKDVKGWGNCLWGMNKMEVLVLYPNSIVEKNNTLVKKGYDIDSYNFEVTFLFDSLQFKLNKIMLVEQGIISKGSSSYKLFRKKLIEKYGSPVLTEEPEFRTGKEVLGDNNFTTLWTFASSSLELQLVYSYSSQRYTLAIIYNEKRVSEKL
ncbi:MAG: hypothetical protein CO128_01670 [Ignavibacteriales bacterium CG_4_9_14_3_um_filter_30_11]|nr:MAG: hypothetical protein CO128_01670 [Ignavibacteriales bacterium CG_4_9_14_3_um_filter_30_11]